MVSPGRGDCLWGGDGFLLRVISRFSDCSGKPGVMCGWVWGSECWRWVWRGAVRVETGGESPGGGSWCHAIEKAGARIRAEAVENEGRKQIQKAIQKKPPTG